MDKDTNKWSNTNSDNNITIQIHTPSLSISSLNLNHFSTFFHWHT